MECNFGEIKTKFVTNQFKVGVISCIVVLSQVIQKTIQDYYPLNEIPDQQVLL